MTTQKKTCRLVMGANLQVNGVALIFFRAFGVVASRHF